MSRCKRLLMFIEQSLDVGLQDVVFEPNAPPLWATVERLISNFLTRSGTSGDCRAPRPTQSFFVRCDQTTMTQDDIDAGRLIAVVGVAPAMPAEFVIIQIALTIPATSQLIAGAAPWRSTATRIDPYRSFNFRVEIDRKTVASFSEVSGLAVDGDAVDYREGKDCANNVRKLLGLRKFERPIIAEARLHPRTPR